MLPETPRAEIDMAKIHAGDDAPGFLFAAGTVLIFYWGIPEVRELFPGAILVGVGIAFGVRLWHRSTATEPSIPPFLRGQ